MKHFFWRDREAVPIPALKGTSTPRGCVFLDRDGTLIHDPGYLDTPDDIRIKERVVEGIQQLVRNRWIPVVITNQSGVARGLFSEPTLQSIHRSLHEDLSERDAPVYAWFYCPHLPADQLRPEEEETANRSLLTTCDCRKPKPGLLRDALDDLPVSISPRNSWSVGDRPRDVRPGLELGGRGLLLVPDDRDPEENGSGMNAVSSFQEAVQHILRQQPAGEN